MNDPTQNEAETQELKRENSFRAPANAETSVSTKNPDTMLSIIVLVLACLGLALLAHVVV